MYLCGAHRFLNNPRFVRLRIVQDSGYQSWVTSRNGISAGPKQVYMAVGSRLQVAVYKMFPSAGVNVCDCISGCGGCGFGEKLKQ